MISSSWGFGDLVFQDSDYYPLKLATLFSRNNKVKTSNFLTVYFKTNGRLLVNNYTDQGLGPDIYREINFVITGGTLTFCGLVT